MITDMMDIPHVREARDYAGQMAGQYLDELRQTDAAKLTPYQWDTLISLICCNFILKKKELDPCPF